MSQAGILNTAGSGGGSGLVQFLTGNSGGAVGPDSGNNINVRGSGTISVAGNAGTNTLTITSSGPTYATGTWTPTLLGSSTAGTPTYASQVGYYTTVGNIVFCEYSVTLTTLSGGSGNITLGGLPFTVSNTVGIDLIVFTGSNNGAVLSPGAIALQLLHNTRTATVGVQTYSTNSFQPAPISELQGSDNYAGAFFYFM